jgi:hypothetical protein
MGDLILGLGKFMVELINGVLQAGLGELLVVKCDSEL